MLEIGGRSCPLGGTQALFRTRDQHLLARVERLVAFYEGLGFRETFRTPKDGEPFTWR
jgi:hypothetical protein